MNEKKSTAIKTPLAFGLTIHPILEDDDEEISEEEILKMRKILKEYEELNKLYDVCIQRIQNRNEK